MATTQVYTGPRDTDVANVEWPDLSDVAAMPRPVRLPEVARRLLTANPGLTDAALAGALMLWRNPSKRACDYWPMAEAEVKVLRTDGAI